MTVLLVMAAVLTVPVATVVAECLLGLPAGRAGRRPASAPPFAVLIPAHDEASGIAATVACVTAQLRESDRVLVVADNCSDATAEIARAAGADVLARIDPARRGKGFALAAGRDALRGDPPGVVVILDADCRPDRDALQTLASAGSVAVVQGLYLLEARRPAPVVALSTFAFLVKNLVRQRGLRRMGAPALLQGSGMAFPWPLFANAPLASADLVEDLELGLKLALNGTAIRFDESAVFRSDASSAPALVSQRTRWEHGYLAVAARYGPRLLAAGLLGRPRLLLSACDLIVPPLAILVLALLLALACATVGGVVGAGFGAAIWLGAMLAALGAALAVTWRRFGREMLPFALLVQIPRYILWKVPIYARLIGRRERRWIRTEREPPASAG